jgi:hypothetical protein
MFYLFLSFLTYIYLLSLLFKYIAPWARDELLADEAVIFVFFGLVVAVLAALVWPVSLLIGVPFHVYMKHEKKRK